MILALVPLLPLVPISVFGTLALFSLAVLFASAWLPSAPVVDHAAAPAADAAASGLVARRPAPRRDDRRLRAARHLRPLGRERGLAVGHGRRHGRRPGGPDARGPRHRAERRDRRRHRRRDPAHGRRRPARPRRAARGPARRRRRAEDRRGLRDRPDRVHRGLHRVEHPLRDRVHVLRRHVGRPRRRRPLVGPAPRRLPRRLEPDAGHRRGARRGLRLPGLRRGARRSRASSSPFPHSSSPASRADCSAPRKRRPAVAEEVAA